ncbi:nucleotidyltransferase domain-containing protein [Pelomicrobium methylotrophicum]|uniref:nucleotidyltransferase domain-containing protein n=1 Tax=Pelomicrobium methylotrophicum TaxID=2602750 RepID=UPI001969E8D9
MLAWPDRAIVDHAVRDWAAEEAKRHPGVLRIGYFGSYARGDWGVGSDVDLVAVVEDSPLPFHERATRWNILDLPVPAELLVYTRPEWERLMASESRFAQQLVQEIVWVLCKDAG